MGLDMYLSKRLNIKNYNFTKEEDRYEFKLTKNGQEVKFLKEPEAIIFEAAYWRKANQIHNWFVENVQDGNDDCREYYVSVEQLKELLQLCKKVKVFAKLQPAKLHVSTRYTEGKQEKIYEDGFEISNWEEIDELLPTTAGFFFGHTGYDEYYLRDIEDTITMLEEALEDVKDDDYSVSFYYQSSW